MIGQRIHVNSQVIWLFNYTSLTAMDGDKNRLVFLSEREMNIIWQATKDIDLWQSRIFTEATGDVYTIVSEEQFEEFKGWVSDTRLSLGDFEMIEPILEDIRDAIQALAARECCPGGSPGGGSRGAGLVPEAESSIASDSIARLSEPPEGFEEWPEYDTYKCDMAHSIISDMISDIATTGILSAGGLSIVALAAAFVAAFLTPIGWALMVPLAGLVINLFIVGANVSALTSFLGGKRDELVCGMLSGNTVADSISGYSNVVSDLVPEDATIIGYGSVAEYLAISILTAMATTDSFNRLYKKVPYEIPTGQDCSSCEEASWQFEGSNGSGDSSANPMVLSGSFVSSVYRLYICKPDAVQNITFTSITGYTASPSGPGSNDSIHVSTEVCGESASGDLYQDDDFPTGQDFDTGWIGFNSTTAFTVTLTKA